GLSAAAGFAMRGPYGKGARASTPRATPDRAPGTPVKAHRPPIRYIRAMPLAAGTRLGPYEISTPLGAGGMGEVYRARDTRLGREVAIKVLPASLSGSPETRARFEREARTVSSLNHPHICTLHDVGREGDTDFLVMELVDGETLAQRL